MTWKTLLVALIAVSAMVQPVSSAWAQDEIEKEEQAAKDAGTKPEYLAALKEKYALTDDQITAMQAKGLNAPHMAFTAQLAKSSGKSIDEVMKMRLEQKMGWGKIAKELGVHPREIGQSVASLRRSERAESKLDANMDKREARREDRMERKAARDTRKAEKASEKSEKGPKH
jgi:hypothetical protein